MKDKLKNTLEHEVELLGRSISVLAIAGLLVVGGASAALLNSFGTVSGDAAIDQAVTVNGVSADDSSTDAFSQTYDFAAGNAPYDFGDFATVQNNLGQEVTVGLEATTSSPGDASDSNVDSGGFDTGYLFIDNGETYSNVRGEGDAEAQYVYKNGQAAVHAYGTNPSGGANEAGLRFNVSHEFSRDNTVTVDSEAGTDNEQQVPDWIKYRVELDQELTTDVNSDDSAETFSEGTEFYLSDVTVDAGDGENTFTDSQDDDQFGDFVVYTLDSDGDYVQSDVRASDLNGISTIEDLIVATGDGADSNTEFDIYYYDVDFNEDDLTQTFGTGSQSLDLGPNSESELGVANSVALNAYPGTYSVTTDIQPQE